MLCRKPFVKNGTAHGCGQCLPCRLKRKKEWTHRIMLESLTHSVNCFLTLTYSDESLPVINVAGKEITTVDPKDLQLWLKRFREALAPLKMRFYAVGEYGDVSLRPHYHVVLFGVDGCRRGRTKRVLGTNLPDWENCCDVCLRVGKTWGLGLIEVGELNPQSAAYIAEYTVKKLTRFDDGRLGGRHPEFARMSLRPGIGADSCWQLASDMMRMNLDEILPDVPHQLEHGRIKMPLGRYLRRKVRVMIGKEEGTPDHVLKQMEAQMRPLREAAFNASTSFSAKIVEAFSQPALNQKTRMEIFKHRKSI